MRIEILLAAFNGAAYLREQLDSILAQTDTDWHLTVSDDGSDDETVEILNDYARNAPDCIARAVSGKAFGNAKDHFFFLMKHCKADWMMFSDQDDTWIPEKVAKFRNAIRLAEERYGSDTPLLIFSDQKVTDGEGNVIAPSLMRYQKQYFDSFDYRSILMQNVVTGGAMAANRALVQLVLNSAGDSRIIMHDWWLAAVAARFGQIVYLDEPTGTYRQHSGNAVGAKHVGSAAYTREKMSRLDTVQETILRKKAQAAAFREAFADRLKEADLAFLQGFTKKKSGVVFYLKYGKLLHGPERKAGMMILG